MNKYLEILVGIPAAGKSTFYERHSGDLFRISADTMRQVIAGDMTSQDRNFEVFEALEVMVEYLMILNKGISIDNTNVKKKNRKVWIDLGKKYGYKIAAAVLNTDFASCVERNEKRERKVPLHILETMQRNLEMPTYDEGFDIIEIFDYPVKQTSVLKN